MYKGTSFGMTSVVEKAMADNIIPLVPSIEKLRFVSSAAEATMTALRIALRFYEEAHHQIFWPLPRTCGCPLLIQAGSGLVGLTPTSSSSGIPLEYLQKTIVLPFNDFKAAEQAFCHPELQGKIAAHRS